MKPLIYFVSFFLLAGCCGHNKYFNANNDFVFYQNGKSLIDPDPNQMRVFSYDDQRIQISHNVTRYQYQDTTSMSIGLPEKAHNKAKYLIMNYKLNRTDTLALEYIYHEDCNSYEWKIQKATLNGQEGVLRNRLWVFNLK